MSFWRWLKDRLSGDRRSAEGLPTTERPTADAGGPRPQRPRTDRVLHLPGDLLQFGTESAAGTDVVLGLDFGTSSVKVAVQTPYALGGRTVVVDFGSLGHPSCTYLLPAGVYRDESAVWSLAKPVGHHEYRGHLKLPLLGEIRNKQAPSDDSTEWAVAFLALALREAREMFLRTQADTYGSIRFRWAMNLGIPSAGYDDAVIRSRFLEVGRAAWMASLVRDVSLGTVRQAIESVRVGPLVSTSTVAVVPEVAAEMVGYARSKFRRPGLHAVVDIGASTLDICGISLFTKDGDDTYELLTADVTDMGFLELHSRRMFAANWRPPFNQVPADIVAPLAAIDACDHELRNRIEQSDEKYVDAAAAIVLRTLAWLHKRRAPVANAWSDGLPLFVTGGGADTPIARRIITRADKRAKDIWINYRGLVAQPLPMNIVDPAGNGARGLSRMAVAYGLSFPEINIGNIVPPGEIPDAQIDPPRRKDWQRAFIDKDAV